MIRLPKILPSPRRPGRLPESVKWLAGEGAGSWFVVEKDKNSHCYIVSRFSPEGVKECESLFKTHNEFDLKKPFELTYPSHCAEVNVIQGKHFIRLVNVLEQE